MRIEELKTPCYVIDEKQLKKNLSILQKVEKDTGCKILLAQKAFSCFYEYPLIGQYLSGTTASGLFAARLGKEEMGKENHVFAPAYKEEDVKELVKISVKRPAWESVLTRSVPHRGIMQSMIHVQRARVSV